MDSLVFELYEFWQIDDYGYDERRDDVFEDGLAPGTLAGGGVVIDHRMSANLEETSTENVELFRTSVAINLHNTVQVKNSLQYRVRHNFFITAILYHVVPTVYKLNCL